MVNEPQHIASDFGTWGRLFFLVLPTTRISADARWILSTGGIIGQIDGCIDWRTTATTEIIDDQCAGNIRCELHHMSRADDIDALEDIVERIGAVETVNLIAGICTSNSEEAESEGDEELAGEWETMADILKSIDWEE